MKPWRELDRQVGMLIDVDRNKNSSCRIFHASGLMQHLAELEKECILHFGIRKYLEKLYANFHGKNLGHKYLYEKGDENYKKAEAIENYAKERDRQDEKSFSPTIGDAGIGQKDEEKAKYDGDGGSAQSAFRACSDMHLNHTLAPAEPSMTLNQHHDDKSKKKASTIASQIVASQTPTSLASKPPPLCEVRLVPVVDSITTLDKDGVEDNMFEKKH